MKVKLRFSTSTILINNFNNEGSVDVKKKRQIKENLFARKKENDNDK